MWRTAPAARARAAGHGVGRQSHPAVPPHPQQHRGRQRIPAECSSQQAHTGLGEAPPGVPSERRPPTTVRHQVLGQEGHDRALVADDLVARRGGLGAGARARRVPAARTPPSARPGEPARASRDLRPPAMAFRGRALRRIHPVRGRLAADGVAAPASDADRPGDQRRRTAMQGTVGIDPGARIRSRPRREPAVRLEQPLARSVSAPAARPARCTPRHEAPSGRCGAGHRAQSTSATASSSRKATMRLVPRFDQRAVAGEVEAGDRLRHVAHRGEPATPRARGPRRCRGVVHHQDLGRRHGLAQQRIERALKERMGRSRVHTAALRRMAVIPSAAGRAGPPRLGGSSGCPRPPGRRSRPAERRAPRAA